MNENQITKGQIFEKPNANAVGAHDCARNSRGITLVALIITIIVMLILVAVTITIAIKGNLFGTTKNVAKQMTIEAYKENLEAIRVNAMMEQIKNNLTSMEFMDKVEEGIVSSKVFEERQALKKTSKSVKVTTKEGYLFKITENKVMYMGLAGEQGELTLDLVKDKNTFFTFDPSMPTKGPVTVAIDISVDEEEMGAILEYSTDGNTWQEYTGPVALSNNGDKIYARLYSEEEDEVGSVAEDAVENIDRLNPKPITNFSGTSTDSSITLTGNTEDAEATNIDGSSGIKAYYYSMDNGTTWLPQNGTLETSYTFTGLPDTTTYTTLKMRAVDNAGNEVITEAITVATKKVNKPYVGDYVNYTPQTTTTTYPVSATYSGYTDQEIEQITNLKWRILNINGDGTIDLINDTSYTGSVNFYGALGYNNAVYLLNDICKILYSNSKYNAVARSIKIEDIQDKMDLSVWDYHNYRYDDDYGYGDSWECTETIKNYPYQWSQEKSEKNKNAVDGVPTNGTLGQSEQRELTTEDEKEAENSITLTQTYWMKAMTSSNFKAVKTRDNEEDNNIYMTLLIKSKKYLVASRLINKWNTGAEFGVYKVNNVTVKPEFFGYIGANSPRTVGDNLCIIITLPKTSLDLSANYEDTGAWNLKP